MFCTINRLIGAALSCALLPQLGCEFCIYIYIYALSDIIGTGTRSTSASDNY
jgi:hypothetical protein